MNYENSNALIKSNPNPKFGILTTKIKRQINKKNFGRQRNNRMTE